jgi:carboxypeptidase Q
LPEHYPLLASQLHEASVQTDFAWNRLAELCDRFGPRFSGSTNLENAIDWVIEQMKEDGLEAVRGEPVMVPRWVRGQESVQVLQPWQETLPMLSLGGSIGTPPDGITAPILVVTNYTELHARADEARGRIVVYDVPFTRYGESVRYRYSGAIEAAKVGAVASLVRSIGDFGLRTPHTGSMAYAPDVPRIPHAALAMEDTQRLRRWQERGVTPVLTLHLAAEQFPDSLSRNVIAEIRGREFPDEIVLVGGHIDSWDVGLGAVDDGGGCIAAWEVLRLVRQLGLRPRRTLRCVLWTNEENGLRGARAYRDQHATTMDQHIAAMESDTGTFQPFGFGFTGSNRGLAVVQSIAQLIGNEMGAGQVFLGGADADTGPLLEAGVPVLGLRVDRSRYFWYHHTDADTPDKVDPLELSQCAAAFAIMAFTLADLPEPLPR